MRTAARAQDDARPRGKPHAYLDSDGYVYSTKRASGMPTIIFICIGFAILGALAMMNRFHIPFEALAQPLATASVQDRTALPTAPYAPPAASGGGEDTAPAAPTSDYGIPAYNAQKATEAAQEGPGATGGQATDNEAAMNAWLEGEPSTPTATPGMEQALMDAAVVVMDTAFDASFSDVPACSPFIGYVAGSECHALAQTATAGE